MVGSTLRLWIRRGWLLALATGAGLACSRSTPLDDLGRAQSGAGAGEGQGGEGQGGGGTSGEPDPPARGGTSGGGVGAGGAAATGGRAGTTAPPPSAGRGGRAGGAPSSCRMPSQALCVNDGDVNRECGAYGEQPPNDGPCAPAGECCHRSSNTAKVPGLCRWEPLELEYRVAFSAPRNHPNTLGDPVLLASNTARKDFEMENTLWRLRVTRGQPRGAGDAIVGPGRYNCDGTYSFYGPTAAPAKPGVHEDVARWAPHQSRSSIDLGPNSEVFVSMPLDSDLVSRERMFMPVLAPAGFTLDSELVSEGFNFEELDVKGQRQDCIGSRRATEWIPGGTYETYLPMEPNDREELGLIGQTHCQLLAFGVLRAADKNTITCTGTSRCQPGTPNCAWRKLPDSLCPINDAERKLFSCHLGDRTNANQEAGFPDVQCAHDVPVVPVGTGGALAQCCDAFGTDGALPPCNAYRVVYDFTAIAVEITDTLADSLQQGCP
jgi:hypothetical protein